MGDIQNKALNFEHLDFDPLAACNCLFYGVVTNHTFNDRQFIEILIDLLSWKMAFSNVVGKNVPIFSETFSEKF